MAPVLFVARFIYKKIYNRRQWAATWIIVLGCATYIFSRPISNDGDVTLSEAATTEGASTLTSGTLGPLGGLIGAAFILAYLFFDGLTSTTQERYFGISHTPTRPLNPDSPVLDQLIWINIFASVISLLACVASWNSTFAPSLALLMSSPRLMLDLALLALTSSVGLILLLNSITSFGALNTATVMTLRQFTSILINAGIFGDFTVLGPIGWTGIGWVIGGLFVKMDLGAHWSPSSTLVHSSSIYGNPRSPTVAISLPEGENLVEKEHYTLDGVHVNDSIPLSSNKPQSSRLRRYILPLLLPLALGLTVALFTGSTGPTPATIDYLQQMGYFGAVEDDRLGLEADDDDDEYLTSPVTNTTNTDLVIEGGLWANELHTALNPTCPEGLESVSFLDAPHKTVLATFPRSGT